MFNGLPLTTIDPGSCGIPQNPRFTTRSAEALAGDFTLEDLGFIFVPSSLRRTQILLKSQPQICAIWC